MDMLTFTERLEFFDCLLVNQSVDDPGSIIHHEASAGNLLQRSLHIIIVESVEPDGELSWREELEGHKLFVRDVNSH